MSKATRLLMLVALVLAILPCIFGGHLVHDFYKCSSDWYRSFFKRCKRNLNQYENDGEMTKSSLAMMLFSTVLYLLLWTVQKSMLQKTKLISGRVGHGIFWSISFQFTNLTKYHKECGCTGNQKRHSYKKCADEN